MGGGGGGEGERVIGSYAMHATLTSHVNARRQDIMPAGFFSLTGVKVSESERERERGGGGR